MPCQPFNFQKVYVLKWMSWYANFGESLREKTNISLHRWHVICCACLKRREGWDLEVFWSLIKLSSQNLLGGSRQVGTLHA